MSETCTIGGREIPTPGFTGGGSMGIDRWLVPTATAHAAAAAKTDDDNEGRTFRYDKPSYRVSVSDIVAGRMPIPSVYLSREEVAASTSLVATVFEKAEAMAFRLLAGNGGGVHNAAARAHNAYAAQYDGTELYERLCRSLENA